MFFDICIDICSDICSDAHTMVRCYSFTRVRIRVPMYGHRDCQPTVLYALC